MPLNDKHIETKRHRHGPVATYEVFVDDFNRIEEEAEKIGSDLTFATFWLSEAVTSTFALPTVPPQWVHIFSLFFMAMLVGFGLGLFHLFKWSRQKSSLKRLMQQIRDCQIPEFGEEGKELRSSELENLTPVEPAPEEKTPQ